MFDEESKFEQQARQANALERIADELNDINEMLALIRGNMK